MGVIKNIDRRELRSLGSRFVIKDLDQLQTKEKTVCCL